MANSLLNANFLNKSIVKRADEAFIHFLSLWHFFIIRKAHSPLRTDEVTNMSMT